MALPAGRYGVTKNQLLKIKKLPMNTIKLIEELTEKFNLLGTAAFKNSTSVVTESSDLVESGAVYDAVESAYQLNKDTVGWSGKNQLDITESITSPQHTVTIAVNSNKSISFYNTADAQFYFYINRNVVLDENEKYILSGVSPNQYGCKLQIYDNTHSAWIDGGDTGDGFIITGYSNIRVAVVIPKNAVMDGVTWYPMIRRANIIDPTYEPYHASVADSLAEKADNSVIGTVEDGINPTKSYAVGEHMIRGGKFCTVTVAVTTSSTWTLGSNYVEGTIADNLVKQATFSGTTSDIGAVVIYNSNDRVILSAEIAGYTTSLYKRSAGYGCVIRTPQGEALINTAVSLTYYYI